MKINNPKFRLNNLYDIVDYNGKKIPLKLNKSQSIVLEAFLKHKRIIVLKDRQSGLTTQGGVICTDMCIFIPNFSTIIIPHTIKLAKEVFQKKCRDTYKFLVEKSHGKIIENGKTFNIPKADLSNSSEMLFDNGGNLKVVLDATGYSANHIHMTEASSNDNAKEVFSSFMSSLNDGSCIIESTALGTTGKGKFFYDFWTDSVAGKTGFHPVFLAWHYQDRYEKEVTMNIFPDDIEEIRQYLSEYPREQQNRKLQWYHDKKLVKKEFMKQDYPCFPNEAFLSSGFGVFDIGRIHLLQADPLYYDWDKQFPKQSNDVDEGLRIYRKPTECVISIDTAGGNANGDYTAISVRDYERNLLAHYYGRANPEKTRLILQRLDQLGYIGVVVSEINASSGGVVFEKIDNDINNGVLKSVMYRRQRSSEDVKQGNTGKLGWDTNAKTRKDILENFIDLFDRELLDEIDDRQLHEMTHFHTNDSGKMIASVGEHDDAIMCDAICLYIVENEGRYMIGASDRDIGL